IYTACLLLIISFMNDKINCFYDRLRLYSLGVIQNCFLKAVGKWLWLEKHEMNYQFLKLL
ncbi:MAG: hypothetical protein WAX60_18230, partial [Blautia wexlerae]